MIDFCEVPTCFRGVAAAGRCGAHYTRKRLGISDDLPMRIYGDDVARFWSKVEPGAADDCWTWLGSKTGDGYGQVSIRRKPVYAHRWAYEHLRVEIPAGLELDHLCRNRACVNPWHLDPVTHAENMRRIYAEGVA